MRRTLLFIFLSTAPVLAQQTQIPVSYTVAIYAPSATNPNTSTPISTAVYLVGQVPCGQVKLGEVLPLVNVNEARFDDPADPTKDCVANIAAQANALPEATGYRAALRANGTTQVGLYGAFTSPFERRYGAPPPPANPRLR
jgi:hypothetical protein